MRIDRDLNVVIPIPQDEGKTLYIHMVPLRYEVFEQYFLPLSKTFTSLYANGLTEMVGPKIAYLMLKQIATESGTWEEIEKGFISECMRTSTALVLGVDGWVNMPVSSAIGSGLLSDEDVRTFLGNAVFFSCIWSIHTRSLAEATLRTMSRLWGQQITLLSATDYRTSLTTSTTADNTGENPIASSVIS
jgi:hypothetical protein